MFFTKVWLFKIMNADANGCVSNDFSKNIHSNPFYSCVPLWYLEEICLVI